MWALSLLGVLLSPVRQLRDTLYYAKRLTPSWTGASDGRDQRGSLRCAVVKFLES